MLTTPTLPEAQGHRPTDELRVKTLTAEKIFLVDPRGACIEVGFSSNGEPSLVIEASGGSNLILEFDRGMPSIKMHDARGRLRLGSIVWEDFEGWL